ncbi:GrpB family protein [Oceanimonas baumannii]|uniref:GrpB-like predicted nucleotidyltransferase (UPF0157 family) n=1 Tax=Oceanimonas baumannii TaxID=129578 RepID=A0A235CKB4_9GAMM|nr:GrpB family protein [Oceanimonas baumannii]OYD24993.1 hypothetical protein B6S09_07290 [Oceanimonas baumannii]TDW59766.1 GrpB-like predicted nucleotidyltransferase (UPF0157 family) [Oceanimonas baumannii]
MQILKYKKIEAGFTPWSSEYLEVAQFVMDNIQTERFKVIHFGSTSFKVGGKGIIDLSVLYKEGDLDAAVEHLMGLGFQDQVSDQPFPPSRPRKDGAVLHNGKEYYLHIHVIQDGSEVHSKQEQYKAYMLNNPDARKEYEQSKQSILAAGVTEQEAYGKQKSPFVKSVLGTLT